MLPSNEMHFGVNHAPGAGSFARPPTEAIVIQHEAYTQLQINKETILDHYLIFGI